MTTCSTPVKGRVFLGIALPRSLAQPLLQQLLTLLPQYSQIPCGKIRISGVEQLHITLHFFGTVIIADLVGFTQTLAQYLLSVPPLSCQVTHIAPFPHAHNAHILAAYVYPSVALTALYNDIQILVKGTGFIGEHRHFLPHITLCRTQTAYRFSLSPFQLTVPEFFISEITLFQSEPSAEGSHYIPLQRFYLQHSLASTGN